MANNDVHCRYAVSFMYGAKLVRDGDYTAGKVVLVMMSMLIGGFALGQAAPDFAHFSTGKEAGSRILAVINRKPDISMEGGKVPKESMQVLPRSRPCSLA